MDTYTYTVFLDDGIELTMRCDKDNGPNLQPTGGDRDNVGVPGRAVKLSAPADSQPKTIMRAQKLAAALGVGEVTWTTPEPLEAALEVE